MIKQTALYINAKDKSFEKKEVDDEAIIGPIDFGFKEYEKNKSSFCFGSGVLAGSKIPGTRRLMFTGFSPLWKNFYISTMGGAAFVFHKLGINYICINDCCEKYSIMEVELEKGEVRVNFHPVDIEKVWEKYSDEIGVYALQKYIFDNYAKNFEGCRILSTGPSAMKTRMGAIASAPIVKDEITPVDCWAGRGGLGSKLVQEHKIVGIIYGGDFQDDPDSAVCDMKEINELFEKDFHKKMIQEDMEVTKKYRFDPDLNTGGTLGVNFTKMKGWMLSFNYQSVNFTEEQRLKIHENFVVKHYLKQFNEETIEKKQWKHCGEPCGVLCKKMNGIYKKDYEPYETMGPNAGIFDQRAAEKANHYCDAMGFDAIQVGSLASWIMECISKNLFPKEDFDIDLKPKWDIDNFNVVEDSDHNSNMVCQIIDRVINNEKCEIFRNGIRNAAKAIDERYGCKSVDLAVYNAYGEDGCMVPNQYWVPGMFSPMPIMGKYFSHYGAEYLPPFELGKMNVERMIKEFYSDNSGICRFHRSWVEKVIWELIEHIFQVKIDYYKHHKKLTQKINWDSKSKFWESERVIDLIHQYLVKVQTGDTENEDLQEWIDKFEKDKFSAAREYWQQILNGINEAMKD